MAIKSTRFLVSSSSAILYLFSSSCIARPLAIEGTVKLENGEPIVGGTVDVQEIVRGWNPLSLPSMKTISTVETDHVGAFHVVLPNSDVPIMIRLRRLPCTHTGTAEEVQEATKEGRIQVLLVATQENCEKKAK